MKWVKKKKQKRGKLEGKETKEKNNVRDRRRKESVKARKEKIKL